MLESARGGLKGCCLVGSPGTAGKRRLVVCTRANLEVEQSRDGTWGEGVEMRPGRVEMLIERMTAAIDRRRGTNRISRVASRQLAVMRFQAISCVLVASLHHPSTSAHWSLGRTQLVVSVIPVSGQHGVKRSALLSRPQHPFLPRSAHTRFRAVNAVANE
jgi:hypothetical protein